MDDIVLMVAILVGLSALATLVARVLQVDAPRGWPLGAVSREAWWRMTLPWPPGVQEDDEIAWHVPRSVPPIGPSEARATSRPAVAPRPVPPTRPQPRFVGR